MDDKWIDNIRDKMADYDAVPPAGLLDAVEAKVRAGKIRRRRILWAVAASAAILGGISVALLPDLPDVAPGPLVSDGVGEETGKEREGSIHHIAETTVVTKPIYTKPKSRKVVQAANMVVPTPNSPKLPDGEDKSDEQAVPEKTHTEAEPDRPSGKSDNDRYSEYISTVQPIDKRSDSHPPLSVGVSTSANGLGGVFGDNDIEGRQFMTSSMPRTRMGGGMLGSPNSVEYPEPTFIEMFDHRLPVRASIDFSWPIGCNLSVGTGITYSYLHSDIRYGYSDSPLFKASQKLHFVGIPVTVRYMPWSFRKLDIYGSAGAMAEKCLGGSIKTENSSDPVYRYDGCDSRPFQFSFNVAVGVQYSFVGNYAIFIEPGVGLYLKNGSRLRTIYSERPVTFNVNVGLRFGR